MKIEGKVGLMIHQWLALMLQTFSELWHVTPLTFELIGNVAVVDLALVFLNHKSFHSFLQVPECIYLLGGLDAGFHHAVYGIVKKLLTVRSLEIGITS